MRGGGDGEGVVKGVMVRVRGGCEGEREKRRKGSSEAFW